MNPFARLGLRARLAIALVGTALLAVGLATLLANRGLHPRLSAAAQARLDGSAARFAQVAGQVYGQSGGWHQADLASLAHLSMMNGLTSTISARNGTVISRSAGDGMMMEGQQSRVASTPHATAPVVVNGTTVGTVVISPARGGLLSPRRSTSSTRSTAST